MEALKEGFEVADTFYAKYDDEEISINKKLPCTDILLLDDMAVEVYPISSDYTFKIKSLGPEW